VPNDGADIRGFVGVRWHRSAGRSCISGWRAPPHKGHGAMSVARGSGGDALSDTTRGAAPTAYRTHCSGIRATRFLKWWKARSPCFGATFSYFSSAPASPPPPTLLPSPSALPACFAPPDVALLVPDCNVGTTPPAATNLSKSSDSCVKSSASLGGGGGSATTLR
jgi:hypothetical protein